MTDEGGGNIVGDIGNHQVISVGDELNWIQSEDIPFNHPDIGILTDHLDQWGDQLVIQLNSHYGPGASCQVTGEATQTRTNFQNKFLGSYVRSFDHLTEGRFIQQEVLPHGFLRVKSMLA